jgi:methyl-accepting chemotaxis protein
MVANATSEQSSATDEISQQTTRVNQSAKETGAALDKSTSSTREIAAVCQKLNDIVGMFKLREKESF